MRSPQGVGHACWTTILESSAAVWQDSVCRVVCCAVPGCSFAAQAEWQMGVGVLVVVGVDAQVELLCCAGQRVQF